MNTPSQNFTDQKSPVNSKAYLRDAGFYLTLWGTVVIIYCLLTYWVFSQNFDNKSWTYSVFALGGVFSLLYSRRKSNNTDHSPAAEKVYRKTWLSVAVLLVALWLSAGFINVLLIIPISLLLYGIASLVTGSYTKYLPSVIGAVICIACALISFKYEYSIQHLIAAIGVCFVHVIPGLLMRR